MKTKTKRNLAKVAGILLVAIILLLADAYSGDPVTRFWANNSAVAHAEKLYPNQTFTVVNSFGGQKFRYGVEVQSADDEDTTFQVKTFLGFVTGDNHEETVESRVVTQNRMGDALTAEARDLLLANAPTLNFPSGDEPRQICFVTLGYDPETNQSTDAYNDALTPGMSCETGLVKQIPSKLAVLLQSPAPSQEELTAALSTVKQVMEAGGMPFAYYEVTIIPDSGTYEEQRALLVESGAVAAETIP